MRLRGVNIRFWFAEAALLAFAGYTSQKFIRSHFAKVEEPPNYNYYETLATTRGTIYDCTVNSSTLAPYPLVKSTQCWNFYLDPVAMTNGVVKFKREKPRSREAMARTIAQVLDMDYGKVLAYTKDISNRYRFLKCSSDRRAFEILTNPHLVAGVIAKETSERHYFEGSRLSNVLGFVNRNNEGSYGIEQRFNTLLRGIPGAIKGMRSGGRGKREIVEKRIEKTLPVKGADIYLTIDHRIQYEAETALADGVEQYGAENGWCIVMDVATGNVLAMAATPGFDPAHYTLSSTNDYPNKAISFTYEPGSVMKVITAAIAIEKGYAAPNTRYNTDRYEKDCRGEPKYYKLPGDGSHVWEPTMTVEDAIVHSSNIVIGKLGYEMGPRVLHEWMMKFGFGRKTGIELPGEERGLLRVPEKWDMATRSRAAIGQGVSVTALQLVSAYQAIANDGVRMPAKIVDRIMDENGRSLPLGDKRVPVRVLRTESARTVRKMMLGVASPAGTARRAALRGYSVAGKTGTAQKVKGRSYAPGLYRATFCGIVPSGVVKREETDPEPVPPKVVILVTLDFEECRKFHQGGNSAGPVFKRIAQTTMRQLEIEPDRPDELLEYDDSDYERMIEERALKIVESPDPVWDGVPLIFLD